MSKYRILLVLTVLIMSWGTVSDVFAQRGSNFGFRSGDERKNKSQETREFGGSSGDLFHFLVGSATDYMFDTTEYSRKIKDQNDRIQKFSNSRSYQSSVVEIYSLKNRSDLQRNIFDSDFKDTFDIGRGGLWNLGTVSPNRSKEIGVNGRGSGGIFSMQNTVNERNYEYDFDGKVYDRFGSNRYLWPFPVTGDNIVNQGRSCTGSDLVGTIFTGDDQNGKLLNENSQGRDSQTVENVLTNWTRTDNLIFDGRSDGSFPLLFDSEKLINGANDSQEEKVFFSNSDPFVWERNSFLFDRSIL